MKVTRPYHEILTPLDHVLKLIEIAGRTCYKSEGFITPTSASPFVKKLVSSGYESVLEHASMTVKFVCDRGVSHELVRHRIASFSQESTRYCNYSTGKFDGQITFILPFWAQDICDKDSAFSCWKQSCESAEKSYMRLLELGWKPEFARSVLPNSLKTEIVVTANMREWRHILKLRCSEKAHPQMRELMIPLYHELMAPLPELFNRELFVDEKGVSL